MENTEVSTVVSSPSTEIAVSSPEITQTEISSAGSSYDNTDSGKSSSSSVPAVYTPNYTVKAYDSEYKIPEAYHSFINEKNEKEFKQIFSKAYATDVLIGKNNKLRESNDALEKKIREDYLPISKGLDVANKYIANRDFDSFFELLNIPEAHLQDWMLKKLQMKDLPPEQQELYTKSSTTQKQLYQLEQVTEQYRQELESMKQASTAAQVEQRTNELEKILSRSDVKAVADRFDTRLNQAGAFKNEVIQRAQFLFQTKGTDLSAEQAVAEFMKLVATDTPSGNPNNTVIPAKAGNKNPTLPNLAGQTTSPAAQKVKSLADLQALKKQANLAMSPHNN
jgi:hypothetical protein